MIEHGYEPKASWLFNGRVDHGHAAHARRRTGACPRTPHRQYKGHELRSVAMTGRLGSAPAAGSLWPVGRRPIPIRPSGHLGPVQHRSAHGTPTRCMPSCPLPLLRRRFVRTPTVQERASWRCRAVLGGL